jgi:hypothetical protein
MGQLDSAPVTDRPTSVLGAARPAPAAEPEPRRRGPIVAVALVTAAAATAAVVVLTSGGDDPAPTRATDAVRTPAATATLDPVLPAPASPAPGVATPPTTPAPGAAPAPGAGTPAPGASTSLPAGWENRTFQGVTFAVPPGATQPDLVDPGNADAPALFSWTGPSLGSETFSFVSIWIYPADGAPTLGPEYTAITVPGAERAHMWTGPTGNEPASTTVDVHVLAGDRFINLTAALAPGAAGEQMVRALVASLTIG